MKIEASVDEIRDILKGLAPNAVNQVPPDVSDKHIGDIVKALSAAPATDRGIGR